VKDGTVFEVAPGDYIPGIFGMALTKKNTGLRDALQGAIKQTVREGTYGKILEKYDLVDAGLTEDQILINGVGNGL
jgi:polar amino acid transport system substrate-binding protein